MTRQPKRLRAAIKPSATPISSIRISLNHMIATSRNTNPPHDAAATTTHGESGFGTRSWIARAKTTMRIHKTRYRPARPTSHLLICGSGPRRETTRVPGGGAGENLTGATGISGSGSEAQRLSVTPRSSASRARSSATCSAMLVGPRAPADTAWLTKTEPSLRYTYSVRPKGVAARPAWSRSSKEKVLLRNSPTFVAPLDSIDSRMRTVRMTPTTAIAIISKQTASVNTGRPARPAWRTRRSSAHRTRTTQPTAPSETNSDAITRRAGPILTLRASVVTALLSDTAGWYRSRCKQRADSRSGLRTL